MQEFENWNLKIYYITKFEVKEEEEEDTSES